MDREVLKKLHKISNITILNYVLGENISIPKVEVKEKRGVFVTIEKVLDKPYLRGCIGFPYPTEDLVSLTIKASILACRDPRFPPLEKEELLKNEFLLEISVLSKPNFIGIGEEGAKGIEEGDGVILIYDGHSGLFLPQVWEHFKSKEEFLENLSLKAGLPKEMWKKALLYSFKVESFKDKLKKELNRFYP